MRKCITLVLLLFGPTSKLTGDVKYFQLEYLIVLQERIVLKAAEHGLRETLQLYLEDRLST